MIPSYHGSVNAPAIAVLNDLYLPELQLGPDPLFELRDPEELANELEQFGEFYPHPANVETIQHFDEGAAWTPWDFHPAIGFPLGLAPAVEGPVIDPIQPYLEAFEDPPKPATPVLSVKDAPTGQPMAKKPEPRGRARKLSQGESKRPSAQCPMCGVQIGRSADVHRHIRSRHGGPEIPCVDPSCPKVFRRQDHVRDHVRRKHKTAG